MSTYKKHRFFSDEEIIQAAKNNLSVTAAAASLGIRYDTFRKHATRLGVFNPNPGRKNLKRAQSEYLKRIVPLKEILQGKHPHYQRRGIIKKLFEAGLKENKCEICGITEWNNRPIKMQLDHVDGNTYNHLFCNLRMICPNCHSQTDTFCGKNKKS
jgi:hypothetical protein